MEPCYLARHDELSEKTLRMIDKSVLNLSEGNAGEPVDFSEFPEILNVE